MSGTSSTARARRGLSLARMKPSRSAPASTATATSCSRVSPQTFTSGRLSSSRSFAPGSGARISVVPTRTASAPASSAAAPCARDSIPDSATITRSRGARATSSSCPRLSIEKSARFARVDPDHLRAERDRALELRLVVRLDERVEPELSRVGVQRGRTLVVEVAQEQEHGVRAGELRLEQLQLLGEEALREQRHVRRGPRRLHVRERAAEALVDEDRDCGRARALERNGELDRVGARAQVSGGRRAPLHLGDRTETGRCAALR